jgi:6,7-dimethyl-8-ribityllumazine synthase
MARYDDIEEFDPDLKGSGMRIGIAMSRFNIDVSEGLLGGCTAELKRLGVRGADMQIVTAPGALELPLILQTMAQSERFDALVALGCVIRGETLHFEIVSQESARALIELSVRRGIPIGNGILTVDTDAQAWARARPEEGDKGGDAARAALSLVRLKRRLARG